MRIKTIFIIIVTILLTIIIMQNTRQVTFDILFWQASISGLVMMAVVAVISLVIGIMIGRPTKVRFDDSHPSFDNPTGKAPDTLSDEDRDYIN
ncbi:LapA family protein [Mucilaginibacter sp. AW1-3]